MLKQTCMFGEIETFQTPYQKRCEERQGSLHGGYQGTTYCDKIHMIHMRGEKSNTVFTAKKNHLYL